MRISVCIVTYNHEAYIEECVRSVAAQDVDGAMEIVVADDASPDGTATVLAALQREFPDKLRVILREKNLGAYENFADTIAQCRGEYVAFLEGDNTWSDPAKLSRQAAMLDAHPDMAFAFHRTRTLTEPAVPPEEETLVPAEDYPPINDTAILFGKHNPVALGSMMVRRPLLAEVRRWTEGLKLGDWPLCMMLARHGTIGYMPDEMSRQRMHGGGTWTVLPPQMRMLYVLQMLHRVTGLLDGEALSLALARSEATLASWAQMVWSGTDEEKAAARTAIAAMPERDFAEGLLWALLSYAHGHWLGLKKYHDWAEEQLATHRAVRTWAEEQVATHRTAREWAEEQVTSHRAARTLAEERIASHHAARTWAEEQVASHLAARKWAEEQVASHRAARTWAEEQVASHLAARTWAEEQVASHLAARKWAEEQAASHRAARKAAEERAAANRREAENHRDARVALEEKHAQALARIAELEAPAVRRGPDKR